MCFFFPLNRYLPKYYIVVYFDFLLFFKYYLTGLISFFVLQLCAYPGAPNRYEDFYMTNRPFARVLPYTPLKRVRFRSFSLPPSPGEGPLTATKTSTLRRGRANRAALGFLPHLGPGFVRHPLKFIEICKFNGFP